MLNRSQIEYAEVPGDSVPRILVVIDTEEEFDWAQPLARENTGVLEEVRPQAGR